MRESGVHVSQYKGHPLINLPFGKQGKTFGFGVGKARAVIEQYHQIELASHEHRDYVLEIEGRFPVRWEIPFEKVLSLVSYINDIEIFVDNNDRVQH